MARCEKAPAAQRPRTIVIFKRDAIGIATGIGSEIVGRMGEKTHVQKLRARVACVAVLVEHINDRHISGTQHNPARVDAAGQLHRSGIDTINRSTQIPGLPDECPRMVERWLRHPGFFQFAVLDRPAQPLQVGKGQFRYQIRHQIGLSPLPQAHAEKGAGGERPATLGKPAERIGRSVQIAVSGRIVAVTRFDPSRLKPRVEALLAGTLGAHLFAALIARDGRRLRQRGMRERANDGQEQSGPDDIAGNFHHANVNESRQITETRNALRGDTLDPLAAKLPQADPVGLRG